MGILPAPGPEGTECFPPRCRRCFSWERGHPARARPEGAEGFRPVVAVAFPGSVGILPAPAPKGRRVSPRHRRRSDGDRGGNPCGTKAPSRAPPGVAALPAGAKAPRPGGAALSAGLPAERSRVVRETSPSAVAFPGSVGILPAPGPEGRRGFLVAVAAQVTSFEPGTPAGQKPRPARRQGWPRSQQGQRPFAAGFVYSRVKPSVAEAALPAKAKPSRPGGAALPAGAKAFHSRVCLLPGQPFVAEAVLSER